MQKIKIKRKIKNNFWRICKKMKVKILLIKIDKRVLARMIGKILKMKKPFKKKDNK